MQLTLLDKITFQLKTHFPSKQTFEIADFLIDKKTWTIRYVVIDVERKKNVEKKILPISLLNTNTDWNNRLFFSSVSNYFFENTLKINYESYVTRKKEKEIHKEFNLKPYWKNTYPNPAKNKSLFAPDEVFRVDTESHKRIPKTSVAKKELQVFSLKNILCTTMIKDTEVAYIQDLIFDTNNWKIKSVVVNFLKDQKNETYRIPLSQIKKINLKRNSFSLDLNPTLENNKIFNPFKLVHLNSKQEDTSYIQKAQ